MQQIINDFIDYMRQNDSAPMRDADIIADGQDHYVQLAKDKGGKRLGYCLTIEPDGFAHGNFRNFDIGLSESWHTKMGKDVSPAERHIFNDRAETARKLRDAQAKEKAKQVAKACQDAWIFAEDCTSHPYLTLKSVKPYGVRLSGKDILIPASSNGEITTLQRIGPSGFKSFELDGRKKGSFFIISGSTDAVCVVEGYATGASIHEATGCTVCIAFDAYNLPSCAEEIKSLFPHSLIIFCADHDRAGIEQAELARLKIGAEIVYPEVQGEDFNDLHIRAGLAAVAERIRGLFLVLSSPDGANPAAVAAPQQSDSQGGGVDLPEWINDLIFTDSKGTIDHRSIHNACVLIENADLKGIFRYNEFKSDTFICKCPPWDDPRRFEVRRVENVDLTRCEAFLEKNDGLKLGQTKIMSAIESVAEKNKFHPVREYFDSLSWDGVPRLHEWLKVYAMATYQPPEYLERIGTIWMVAAVARVKNPGCKFDHMIVLEGPQNAGKSMLLRTIGTFGRDIEETYYTDAINIGVIEERGSILKLQGNLIIEFPELAGMGKKDQNELKRWITLQEDEVEVKHRQRTQVLPRQFILAGTYNPVEGEGWINDPTGGRRFWPVLVGGKVDIEGLKKVREQLWAEAVVLYNQGMQIFVDDKDPVYKLLQAEQAARAETDVWMEEIANIADDRDKWTISEMLSKLGISIGHQDKFNKARVTRVFKALGWKYKEKSVRGKRLMFWCKPKVGVEDDGE